MEEEVTAWRMHTLVSHLARSHQSELPAVLAVPALPRVNVSDVEGPIRGGHQHTMHTLDTGRRKQQREARWSEEEVVEVNQEVRRANSGLSMLHA